MEKSRDTLFFNRPSSCPLHTLSSVQFGLTTEKADSVYLICPTLWNLILCENKYEHLTLPPLSSELGWGRVKGRGGHAEGAWTGSVSLLSRETICQWYTGQDTLNRQTILSFFTSSFGFPHLFLICTGFPHFSLFCTGFPHFSFFYTGFPHVSLFCTGFTSSSSSVQGSSLLPLLYRVSSLLTPLYRVSSLLVLFLVSQLQTGLPHFSTSLYCFLTSSRVSRFLHGSHYTVKDYLTFLFSLQGFSLTFKVSLTFPLCTRLPDSSSFVFVPGFLTYSSSKEGFFTSPSLLQNLLPFFLFRSHFFLISPAEGSSLLPFLGFPIFRSEFLFISPSSVKAHFSLSWSGFFTYTY